MSSDEKIENVLILQGGGSLGAFGCGVFKALVENNIKIDIVAGTSIGGVNASIIAGSKQEDHPEKALEQFWLELTEGDINSNSYNFINWLLYGLTNPLTFVKDHTRNIHGSEIKSLFHHSISCQFSETIKSLYHAGIQNMLLTIQNILILINGHIYMITLH